MQGGCDQKMYTCRHIERGVNLEKLSHLSKSKLTQCEDCIGKGRSSQKKAARLTFPGQQICQQEEKWVCLACGHVACDTLLNNQSVNEEEESGKLGEKKDENKAPAKGHAWGHFVQLKHPLAMQTGDNNVYWCFICKMPVDYPMPVVDSPNDSNWRNPLQDAADVVRGKTSKKKGLFKDPAKVCYTMEPVRCVIDTVRSVIDSATHTKVIDAGKPSSSLVSAHNSSYGKKHFVKGLINLGNTCFFNSVLQNLLALDVLRNHFSKEPSDNEGPLTSSLRSLFQEMNSDHVSTTSSNTSSSDFGMRRGWRAPPMGGSDGKVCNPSSLFDAICAKAPRFRGFQQQDCHELLRYLLEGLTLEERGAAMNLLTGDYKKVISTSFSKVLGQNGHSGDSELAEEDKEHGKASKPSNLVPTLVESVFGGQLSSTVHCLECGHVSVVYETMLDLSLQIPTRQISKKRQACEEQGTLNLLGGRSQESLKEDTKHEERAGMLETQETLIASTLRTSVSKDCLLGSSLSAQADRLDSTLAIGTEPPEASFSDKFPSYDLDFCNSSGSSAEGSLQNVSHSADKPESTLSTNVGACIPRDHLKARSNPPTLEQSIDLNGSKIDTCLRMDMTFIDGVHSGFLQNNKLQGESSATHSCELLQGKDVLVSPTDKYLASGSLLLPYEPLERTISTNEKGSAYAATECSFDKLSFTEGKDLASSVFEVNEHNESCSQCLESAETVSGKNQEMEEREAFDVHLKDNQVLEKPNLMNFSREANCEASDKVKVSLGSEQFPDSEVTAVPLSLEVCLADFIKSELLCGENAWECEKCSRLVEGTPHSQLLNNKSKTGEGHVPNEAIKYLGDLAESRVENDALIDAEALSRASSVNFEADSPVSAVGDSKMQGTQSGCANSSTLGEKCPFLEGQDDKNIERTGDSQSLLTDKSVISYPLLHKHEQPEGNGLGHTCSKMLPNLKMEKLSFFSNLFFKTENHKVKTDNQQKLVKRQATKKFLICKVPLVLTVHLKRFAQDVRGRLNKLSGHVAFSEYLNLRPFLDPRSPDYNDCVYRLVGIVEHGGTMRGGHYVAYVRGPSDEMSDSKDNPWYHISDSIVSKSTLQDVLGREAYLLFYERHNVKKEG